MTAAVLCPKVLAQRQRWKTRNQTIRKRKSRRRLIKKQVSIITITITIMTGWWTVTGIFCWTWWIRRRMSRKLSYSGNERERWQMTRTGVTLPQKSYRKTQYVHQHFVFDVFFTKVSFFPFSFSLHYFCMATASTTSLATWEPGAGHQLRSREH